ncbi:fam-c protein [Plasmodium vinckei brucechwatti]|uniref:Fam-c protein n=1 Tax=Plasmodium vinckei brucechwatti TaxID=119398 RepID=A0A6V7SDV5_PLAVN|nr:fam-c protein [Plasmodium vinckei brucechwatti]
MNKRIFSLVCIVLYALLAVSIHCSEQKTSGLRSRIIRAIKKIQRNSKKNGIESERETQLNNNNNKDYIDLYGDNEACIECCCGCLFIDGVCV